MAARITERDLRELHGGDVEIIDLDRERVAPTGRYTKVVPARTGKKYSAATGFLALVVMLPLLFAIVCGVIVLIALLVAMWFVFLSMVHTIFGH